uniref:Hydantoinase B/oxoprolinase domain-containing protein n=1 Tax=Corethron hystrix TaxID=216773 RepID=A0A7S1BG06_9STRA
MSILSERRVLRPYGMAGGGEGKQGLNLLIKGGEKRSINIGGRCTTDVDVGDRIRIETPGGGGYGKLEEGMEDVVTSKKRSAFEFIPHGQGKLAKYANDQNTV